MVPKKRMSKRQTLKQKYKVVRKVKDAQRKMKRAAKKDPTRRKKLKKDPGIPNLFPFKEQVLSDIQEKKEIRDREAVERRERRENEIAKARAAPSRSVVEQSLMSDYAADVLKKSENHNDREIMEADVRYEHEGLGAEKEGSRKAYARELQKVVEASDVILEVVDARDPQGCRSKELESAVVTMAAAGQNKRLVIVLNKMDLIPRKVALKWIEALKTEFPALGFWATAKGKISKCGSNLMELLKNYCRNRGLKTAITVGIVGIPNVGKSSIINSLKRSKAVEVGSTAGMTKVMQKVQLDKQIKLLDCPGVVLAKLDNKKTAVEAILRNSVKVQQVLDPSEVVNAILERIPTERMVPFYQIPLYSSTQEFLSHVAQRRGKLKKGGVPDFDGAARIVIGDWNTGRLKWFTPPPVAGTSSRIEQGSMDNEVKVVSEWGQEFSLDDMMPETLVLEGAEMADESFFAVNTVVPAPSKGATDMEEMPTSVKIRKVKTQPVFLAEEESNNPRINREKKKAAKQRKRERERELYDFSNDFMADTESVDI